MKTMLLIYNPHSGKGKAAAHLPMFVETFTAQDWLVTVRPTRFAGDAEALCAEIGANYDRVVCCGGDGTLHEVVTGLMSRTERPQLACLPAGSTNDFGQNLALPRSYKALAETAAAGFPAPCDMGRFNGKPFVYVAAFGAFTDVTYDTPQSFKNLFGHTAYLLNGIARLPSITSFPLHVEYDGGTLDDDYVLGIVSNTISVGGFKGLLGTDIKLNDGLFEVVLVKMPQNATELHKIINSALEKNYAGNALITTFRTSRIRFTGASDVAWTLDGEYGGTVTEAEIENCRSALTVVRGAPEETLSGKKEKKD